MTVSRLDQLYRRLLLTKFFTRGWGKPDNLKRLFAFRKILSNRETCQHLVPADYPINIDKECRDGDCIILEGHFMSPFVHHLPGIMPKEVETASFQMLLPNKWRHSTLKPVCIHLAGTGDHYFWRRRILTARPLLKEAGIASILLENPYYGTRKPKQQLRSSLHNVSDLFVMGGALVLESLALLHWCEREGWGPLGLSGVSMGGHMASLAATNWTKPIALVPCLSWSTASCVFTQGVMSGAIPWKTLQEQFFENSVYQDEIRKLIISPEDTRKAYVMGQQFVKEYSHNILQVESIHEHLKDNQPPMMSSSEKPMLPDTRSLSAQVSKSFTQGWASVHPTTSLDSSEICDKNTANSSIGLKSSFSSKSQTDALTCEEYIARVDKQQSFTEEPGTMMHSPSREPAQSIISAVSSGNPSSALSTLTSSSPSMSSHQHSVQSAADSLQQQSILSSADSLQQQSILSSGDSSASKTDKRSKQTGILTKEPASQSTTYARISQSQQQSSIHSMTESSSLTLKDAFSKSRLMIPHLLPSAHSTSDEHMKDLQQEALDFMRGVMDECTHLGNFSVPVDPELVIIVSARQDAYVPKEGVIGLDQLWPGCEVRYVDQGHVGAVLFNQSVFRKAVVDAFDRQIKKYYQTPGSPDMKHSAESAS